MGRRHELRRRYPLLNQLCEIVEHRGDFSIGSISPFAHLVTDLGIDSLDFAEILLDIEDKIGKNLEQELADKIDENIRVLDLAIVLGELDGQESFAKDIYTQEEMLTHECESIRQITHG